MQRTKERNRDEWGSISALTLRRVGKRVLSWPGNGWLSKVLVVGKWSVGLGSYWHVAYGNTLQPKRYCLATAAAGSVRSTSCPSPPRETRMRTCCPSRLLVRLADPRAGLCPRRPLGPDCTLALALTVRLKCNQSRTHVTHGALCLSLTHSVIGDATLAIASAGWLILVLVRRSIVFLGCLVP